MALLPVEDARRRILAGVKPLPAEVIALDKACGRVLARPVPARRDQPPFAASAMDGYAVRFADVRTLPATLRVVGTSAAGHRFRGQLADGSAVRIFTGAPLPAGADTVVIQENTVAGNGTVTVVAETVQGKNIRKAGLDFRKGEELLPAGLTLRPRDIGLAAAGNAARLQVRRKPKVVLFATGDELVLPGQSPKADQIVSSNSHAIAAMVQQLGGEVVNLGIVPDTLRATITAVRKGLGADVLLTTGGASVGDHDFVQAAFKACGVTMDFWKLALRPGKPFMYGRKGKTHVMGLPGNPVSALLTTRLFLKPLLAAMAGLDPEEAPLLARLTAPLPANDHRQDYMRATAERAADGTWQVAVFGAQDSSMQRTLQRAQALIVRPPNAPAAEAGSAVPVLLLDF